MPRPKPVAPPVPAAERQLLLFGPAAGEPAGAPAAPSDLSGPRPHPRANCHLQLDGHRVAYELRRARRRTIGFVIGPDGLSVSAPRWVGQPDIDQALQAKAGWILRKLHEQGERARRLEARRIRWCDGGEMPFLGAPLVLRLDAGVSGVQLDALALDAAAPALGAGPTLPATPAAHAARPLRIGLPAHASEDQVREAVQSWLQRQARRVFEERCALYAPRLGVRVSRLSLSSAATRWGSASADGSVRLNWRLVHHALPVVDYVVVHELAHLREMNHSPAFWDVVRSVVPDYEARRQALRGDGVAVMD